MRIRYILAVPYLFLVNIYCTRLNKYKNANETQLNTISKDYKGYLEKNIVLKTSLQSLIAWKKLKENFEIDLKTLRNYDNNQCKKILPYNPTFDYKERMEYLAKWLENKFLLLKISKKLSPELINPNKYIIKAYIRDFVNSSELNIPTELITIIENYYYPTFYHIITDLDNGKTENYKCKKQIISILYSYKDYFFNNYIITMEIGTKIRNEEILEITNLNEYSFQYINDAPKFSSALRQYYEISSLSFIRK